MNVSAPALPTPNRIVTGHTDDGKSTVAMEGPIQFSSPHSDDDTKLLTRMSVPWEAAFPSPLSGTDDPGRAGWGVPVYDSNKTRFWITDTPPGGTSPMHRTVSLDYGICLSGEMTVLLEDGSERLLKTGDIIVQRGTLHQWLNKTDKWCRMMFVCCGAEEPLVINGKELKTEFRV